MPHENIMIVRQTSWSYSLDWKPPAIQKKEVCCVLNTIAGYENKEIDDFENTWFCAKWICISVNVIADCDSVEMQIQVIKWNWLTVLLVDAMKVKLYFLVSEIYYSQICLNFTRHPIYIYTISKLLRRRTCQLSVDHYIMNSLRKSDKTDFRKEFMI